MANKYCILYCIVSSNCQPDRRQHQVHLEQVLVDDGTAILRRLKRQWFRGNSWQMLKCALQATRRRLEPRIKQRNVEKSLINTNSVAVGRTIRGGDKRISGSVFFFFFFVYGSGVEMTTAVITDEFFYPAAATM